MPAPWLARLILDRGRFLTTDLRYSSDPYLALSAWRVALEARGLSSVSINVRTAAVRNLAVEAADNGLLAPGLSASIALGGSRCRCSSGFSERGEPLACFRSDRFELF